MKNVDEVIANLEAGKGEAEFLPTGFTSLDTHLDGGFTKKELVVLGGKTGLGKSYLASTFFWNIAQKGFRCAYFSLEISNEMVVSRLLGALSNIKPTRIMFGLLTPGEYDIKRKAKARLTVFRSYMMFYDDMYALNEILSEIEKNEYEFVVIDFLQNIFLKDANDEYTRLSSATLQLQKAAKAFNCCILVLSQLSNQVGREGMKTSTEYKGSGSIATACDLGFLMERVDGLDDKSNPLRLTLKKNRRGVLGIPWEFTFVQPGGRIHDGP